MSVVGKLSRECAGVGRMYVGWVGGEGVHGGVEAVNGDWRRGVDIFPLQP